MASINKVPADIRKAIAEFLSPSDTLSWALVSKENHEELIETLYRNVVVVDNKEHGWPRQLVLTALEKKNSTFKKILEFTPLDFINQANVNARLLPGAATFDSKYWPLATMIQWQDPPGQPAVDPTPLEHRQQGTAGSVGESRIVYPLMTSLLHVVSQLGDSELLEAVLAKGVSNKVYDGMGYSPMYLALKTRNRPALRILSRAGAVASVAPDGYFRTSLPEVDDVPTSAGNASQNRGA